MHYSQYLTSYCCKCILRPHLDEQGLRSANILYYLVRHIRYNDYRSSLSILSNRLKSIHYCRHIAHLPRTKHLLYMFDNRMDAVHHIPVTCYYTRLPILRSRFPSIDSDIGKIHLCFDMRLVCSACIHHCLVRSTNHSSKLDHKIQCKWSSHLRSSCAHNCKIHFLHLMRYFRRIPNNHLPSVPYKYRIVRNKHLHRPYMTDLPSNNRKYTIRSHHE